MRPDELTLRSIRVRTVLAPMRLPLKTSSGAITTAPLVLIDLETSAGITGRAYLFAFTRSNLAPMAAFVAAMGELLAGDAVAPFEIERKLRQKYTLLGVHNVVLMAMAGIDMAAWDAYAQHVGEPLVRVLGGTPRPVRAYNSKGLGIMPLPELTREARDLLHEGFSAVKLRLGRPAASDDLAAVRAVKETIGPDVTLMCDFNQALSVNEAIRRGRMLDEEGGLAWIEEPTRADDFAGNARIAQALDTPVQIGENFMGPEQMAQALQAQACDYVMPDAQRIGGVTGWMRAAALAQGAGIEMSSHLFPEVSCHLLAVTPTCHWLEYVDWAAAILEEPLRVENSHVPAPAAPGIGMRWDEAMVKKYAA
ncbi:MAG TPA: enolase C-terminal domain-like protein [Casimicrobiaceae bacterium]|nr:enolase C-terminal domain-like protein [Casimicrobiaceae bacterium]